MQATARKAAAVFVAAMLAFAMAFVAAPAKAHAAGATGTLTVSSSNAEFNGKEVKVWQMFSATATADGANASYTLKTEWEDFFKGLDDFGAKTEQGSALSSAAVEYVSALGTDDSDKVVDFAKKASDWAKTQGVAPTSTATAQLDGSRYVATFQGLAYGYYVVSPAGGSTDINGTRATDAILANVISANETVELKSEYPTVDKTVEGENHADAQIGDVLNFALTSKVPNMAEYDTYSFNFVDTLSKGLTLDQASIKVSIGGTVLAKDVDYTIDIQTVADEKTQLTVAMKDFKKNHAAKVGQNIEVTYSATLNEKAAAGQDDAGNTVKLQYSNKPGSNEMGESVPDVTHGYTFGFDLKKVDGAAQALAGAEFQLQKKEGASIVKLIVESAGSETDPAIVRPAKQDEAAQAVDSITTPASGLVTFKGLDAIAYQLVELKAPDGFNKLAKPVGAVIAATYGPDGSLQNWTVNGAGHDVDIVVENKRGTLLPETGGMGTIAFTVIGALAVVGGVVWAVRRKRSVR